MASFFWNIIDDFYFNEKVFCILYIRWNLSYNWLSVKVYKFWSFVCWTIYQTNSSSLKITCFMDFGCSVKLWGSWICYFKFFGIFFFKCFIILSHLNRSIVWSTSFLCISAGSESSILYSLLPHCHSTSLI